MWKLQPTSETLKHHHHPLFNFSSEKGSLGMGERRPLQSSDCVSAAQTYASSRWCPTPEQLRALEEFYKRGIRTPSTYQIQQITAQLRRFGKIEGKNVFYWFQNHKARERQRIRRRLSMGSSVLLSDHSSKQMQDHVIKSFQAKSSKDLQAVHNKSWPINAALQEGVSKGRTDTAEGERDGWIQLFLDREIKQFSSSSVEHNNNGISPSRHSHVAHLLTSHISTTTRSNEDHNSCINWQIEPPKIGQQIPNKTLELFPLHGDEKAKEDPVQFYEFL